MRDILFRAKRKGRQDGFSYRSHYKNGDWVCGLITKQYTSEWQDKCNDEMTDICGVSGIEIDRETIGQFTGLADYSADPIFEGDILRVSNDDGEYLTEVRAYGCTLCVDVQGEDYDFTSIDFAVDIWNDNCCEYEVIGNIYDNPELVKEIKG